jgi:hypothetical protein
MPAQADRLAVATRAFVEIQLATSVPKHQNTEHSCTTQYPANKEDVIIDGHSHRRGERSHRWRVYLKQLLLTTGDNFRLANGDIMQSFFRSQPWIRGRNCGTPDRAFRGRPERIKTPPFPFAKRPGLSSGYHRFFTGRGSGARYDELSCPGASSSPALSTSSCAAMP